MSASAAAPKSRRSQEERSAETRERLIAAAVACLIEDGYAHTTTVHLCSRAGLTRGAFHHHYASFPELFVDVLAWLYRDLGSGDGVPEPSTSLETLVQRGWERVEGRNFKAVIELWLAARNDEALRETLDPAIARLSGLFEPRANPALAKRLGEDPQVRVFYRMAFETMIGLALGRATSPEGAPVAHEAEVMEMLLSLAREHDRRTRPRRPRSPAAAPGR